MTCKRAYGTGGNRQIKRGSLRAIPQPQENDSIKTTSRLPAAGLTLLELISPSTYPTSAASGGDLVVSW
jgi:hypothetical protein